MSLVPRPTPPRATAFLAALVVACWAWMLATSPQAQPRFGDTGLPGWRADAPVHQIRPQAQTIVARQPSLPATVVPGSSGPSVLAAAGLGHLEQDPSGSCPAIPARCGPTTPPAAAWPRGPPALVRMS